MLKIEVENTSFFVNFRKSGRFGKVLLEGNKISTLVPNEKIFFWGESEGFDSQGVQREISVSPHRRNGWRKS